MVIRIFPVCDGSTVVRKVSSAPSPSGLPQRDVIVIPQFDRIMWVNEHIVNLRTRRRVLVREHEQAKFFIIINGAVNAADRTLSVQVIELKIAFVRITPDGHNIRSKRLSANLLPIYQRIRAF